jgi:hypothetical protein
MLVALWFYVFVVLVAPWWMLPVMVLLWAALVVVLVKSWSTRPYLALAMPFIALAAWFGIVSAGGAWLGWTA